MTAQIHEILIIDGKKTSMACCPDVSRDHPMIVEATTVVPSDEDTDRILSSTACWRRYQGTWEIKDGRFYLCRLKGWYRLATLEPIFAEWYSGVLRVPEGELLEYVHMGFASVYETELHIFIDDGVVSSTRTIDNRGQRHDPIELAWRSLMGDDNRLNRNDDD